MTSTPAPSQDRWFACGRSAVPGSFDAGAEATSAALAGEDTRLVIVFADFDHDQQELMRGVCSQIGPDVAVAGCTTNGQVGLDLPVDGSVIVAALGGSGFEVRMAVGRPDGDDCRQAGHDAATAAAELTLPHRALLLIMDGLIGAQEDVVRGAYAVAGARVPLVGGCAADNLHWEKTYQYAGTGAGVEILSGTAVGVAIGSTGPLGVGVAHGWEACGEAMMVTSSEGGRLYELDGSPALGVYLDRTGADPALTEDEDAFRFFALDRPLGLSRRDAKDLRVIHGAETGDGSLTCLAEVPPGALAWLMETDREGLMRGAEEACEAAVARLGGAEPLGVLAFDCGVRKVMLGEQDRAEEVERISASIGHKPFAGFYTFGEIARTNGARGMHHLTMVVLAFG